MIAYLLLAIIALCSYNAVTAQVSVLQNYEACRAYATLGIGAKTIDFSKVVSACAPVSYVPGIYHNGWNTYTDAEANGLVSELKALFPGNNFITFPPAEVPVTYCGRGSTLNVSVQLNDFVLTGGAGFLEVTQFHDKPPTLFPEPHTVINFDNDWYAIHGYKPSLWYVSTRTLTNCDIVEQCLNGYDIPVFYKSPVSGPINTAWIRMSTNAIEIICGNY
jgi:hypothetical protein